MEIVGRGFIAKNLAPIAAYHPHILMLAAGVSRTTATSKGEFARERALLLHAIRRARREGRMVVFLSTASSGVYGSAALPGREDTPIRPNGPYATHKIELEHLLQDSGIAHLVLRVSHLVGRHQRPWQLLPSLVSQVESGRVRIRRGARRDLLEVGDMVRITDALLRCGVRDEVVNIASGVSVPIERIVEHIEHRLDRAAVHDMVEAEEGSVIDIGKLCALVPEVATMGFGQLYYRDVLDAFLGVNAQPRQDPRNFTEVAGLSAHDPRNFTEVAGNTGR